MNFSKNNIVLPQNATKATNATLEVKTSGRRKKALWRCAPKIRRYMTLNRHLGLETWSFGHYLENVQTDFGDNASNDFGKILNFWVFANFLVTKIGQKSRFFRKKLQNRKIDYIVKFASNLSSEGEIYFLNNFCGTPQHSGTQKSNRCYCWRPIGHPWPEAWFSHFEHSWTKNLKDPSGGVFGAKIPKKCVLLTKNSILDGGFSFKMPHRDSGENPFFHFFGNFALFLPCFW